jgi:outer membrane protein W
MKRYMPVAFLLFLSIAVGAQNPWSQKVQLEVDLGVSLPSLSDGEELLRAKDLREKSLSYFANENGTRKNVGSYSNQIGWNLTIAYYKPAKWATGLLLGAKVTSHLTGSTPSDDGYDEGYYFNYLSANAAAKYYPFEKANLFVGVETGLGSVFTKNRFINDAGEQNFFHQFGIGFNIGGAIGYTLPFKSNNTALNFQVNYSYFRTRVEVNGIGDDNWVFGSLSPTIGLTF